MKGTELLCAIQCDSVLRNYVLGVYARDTLPVLTPYMLASGVAIIVNTDKRGNEGQHWTAMYFKDNKAELFDSLGEPVHKDFVNYLMLYAGSYVSNPHQFQSSDSNICGLYCLYYLLCKFKACMTLTSISNQFDVNNLLWNDMFISQYMCHYFKYCYPPCMKCI